jgi:hypothetical protein
LIGPSQSSRDHLHKCAVPLKSKLASLRLERRLVCDEGQLVLHKRTERFGNKVELAL